MLKSSMENTIRDTCTQITDIIFGASVGPNRVTLTKEQFNQLANLREKLFKTIQVINRQKRV